MKKLLMLALLPMLIPIEAMAAKFLDGAYGQEDGCHYAKTGESSGADLFLLLNDDGITSSTTVCAFSGTPEKTKSGFKVETQCQSEEEKGQKETVDLTRSAEGYTIKFKDGTRWGPLPKCR